ncbi:MAG TPA: hypothetical protein VI359_09130 [Nitrospiraceae bacterium]
MAKIQPPQLTHYDPRGLSSLLLLTWLVRTVSWVFFLCLTFWALWFLWFGDRHPLDK